MDTLWTVTLVTSYKVVTEMRLCGDYASTFRVQKVSRKKVKNSNTLTFSGRFMEENMAKSTHVPIDGPFLEHILFGSRHRYNQ